MSRALTAEAAARQRAGACRGGARAAAQAKAEKAVRMAEAAAWRESRRCGVCNALGWQPCAHRPEGAE